ncbi:zinc finger protein 37-like isoform X2 [Sander lucioperca]|uniref:zinc finger protein 37-like isoform X2 n=1 Tax=Sander lucioperca TaxID=283035 RepID=UPI001653EAF0|nr:zinc finger protein 37-like isoform X2 [Sander lucioperca]
MLYWMKRSGGGSETTDDLNNMSKTDILRGIVTEKLTTAAQEILAVVERTMAGYEEEASGFRREIDRQRRQLELLQPRVRLDRKPEALGPDGDGHAAVVLSVEGEEEQQRTQPSGNSGNSGEEDDGDFLWYGDDDDDGDGDGGDEEQQLSSRPAASSRQKREDLKDPDFQITPRFSSPRLPGGERRRPGRPRNPDSQKHLDLRVCFLQDSHGDVLSNRVFKKNPVQELRCPRGLREEDFLQLLRSTFPQLAAHEPFELFTTDWSRRLQPLRVAALTPEEIWSSRSGDGSRPRNSALYIRLKSGGEDPPQRPEGSPSASATTSAEETETSARLSSPRVESERRRRGRPSLGEKPTHLVFKVCVLEDPQTDVLSNKVFLKSRDLSCPRGLTEEDFLSLLRSSFPQLAGDDKTFAIFKSDRSRRLQRLKVKKMTPENIIRITKFLYVRLKTGEEEEGEEEEGEKEEEEGEEEEDEEEGEEGEDPNLLWSPDGVPTDSLSAAAVGVKSEKSRRRSSAVQQDTETQEAESQLDSGGDADGDEALDGDDEDGDWKPDSDPEPRTSKPPPPARRKRRAKTPGRVEGKLIERKTPCKVCGVWYRLMGSLIKHAWSHAEESPHLCGVCGENFASPEDLKGHLKTYQKTHECSYCSKAFFTVTGLQYHTTRHTGDRPFKCDLCNKTFPRLSSLSVHRWVHVEDKPYKCEVCPRAFGLNAQLQAHVRSHARRDKYQCNVCGKFLTDLRSLSRHKTVHSGERRYGCEVCGKRFKLANALKSHQLTHTERERPFLCHICCNTFTTNCTLNAHFRRMHCSERPFACTVCGKGFISNGERKAHMRTHTGEAPYGCSECGRFFKRKSHLNNHVRSHLGIKRYACAVCGKACSRQEHLTVHMRTHNGERPYQCTLCDKAFTQSHCLKTHMKSHRGGGEGDELSCDSMTVPGQPDTVL